MEVCESGGEQPPLLHWDRKLSELYEPADPDTLLSRTHFTEFLDEFSPDVLGQLLNDPFLSEKNEIMEVELSLASPAPLIQAEHSYSLCGDSRPQSPLTHISTDGNFNEDTMNNENGNLHCPDFKENRNEQRNSLVPSKVAVKAILIIFLEHIPATFFLYHFFLLCGYLGNEENAI